MLRVHLQTTKAAAEMPIRVCGCTFCTKHRPRYTSDPAGQLTIELADEVFVSRYRFGLRLADFLICRTCGVFVAAFEPGDNDAGIGRAVLNVHVLEDAQAFTAEPTRFTDYDREDAAARQARRQRAWTPAVLATEPRYLGDRTRSSAS
jgi:hypothetical protein